MITGRSKHVLFKSQSGLYISFFLTENTFISAVIEIIWYSKSYFLLMG